MFALERLVGRARIERVSVSLSDPREPEVFFRTNAVEVRVARLDVPPARLALLEHTLTGKERARARRLAEPAGRRFAAARGLLREELGARLGVKPEAVELRTGPTGKLFAPGPVSFNVGHSGDLAVFAFARGREVGIDVERKRSIRDLDRVAAIALSSAENAALQLLPAAARQDAFFERWTRKEAYLKACGDGLSRDPRGVEDADGWEVVSFEPAPGFAGAVCIEAS